MRYAIGIDTGGTTMKAAVVSERGEIVDTQTVATPATPEAVIDAAAGIVDTFCERLRAGGLKHHTYTLTETDVVKTVGFAVPGIVNEKQGIAEFSANLGWKNFRAQDLLSARIARPVAFGHDVRTGAHAESHWGVGHANFLFIAIGTGLSTVLVLNHEPVTTGGWVGELGMIPAGVDTRTAVPLERICSASAIARHAQEAGLVGSEAGAADVFSLYDDAHPKARQIIDSALRSLATALAPVVAVIGPVPIVIGGGMANRGDALITHLTDELTNALGMVPTPPVETAQLGSWAQAQGCALLAFTADTYEENTHG
ncbi:MAG: ROK family protein [Actinomycetaceae bacterium]|nr:ROK family protein [Actinomycetaceae bacterium]